MTALELVQLIPTPPELPSLEGIALGHAVMFAYERRELFRRVSSPSKLEWAEAQLDVECALLMAAREWEIQS